MSRDDQPTLAEAAAASRLADIRADLAYFRKAVEAAGVGSQPPTLYAEKYIADVEHLLGLLAPEEKPPQPARRSDLERALTDDKAGRVERNRRPG
jgi:hypothetical protein